MKKINTTTGRYSNAVNKIKFFNHKYRHDTMTSARIENAGGMLIYAAEIVRLTHPGTNRAPAPETAKNILANDTTCECGACKLSANYWNAVANEHNTPEYIATGVAG